MGEAMQIASCSRDSLDVAIAAGHITARRSHQAGRSCLALVRAEVERWSATRDTLPGGRVCTDCRAPLPCRRAPELCAECVRLLREQRARGEAAADPRRQVMRMISTMGLTATAQTLGVPTDAVLRWRAPGGRVPSRYHGAIDVLVQVVDDAERRRSKTCAVPVYTDAVRSEAADHLSVWSL